MNIWSIEYRVDGYRLSTNCEKKKLTPGKYVIKYLLFQLNFIYKILGWTVPVIFRTNLVWNYVAIENGIVIEKTSHIESVVVWLYDDSLAEWPHFQFSWLVWLTGCGLMYRFSCCVYFYFLFYLFSRSFCDNNMHSFIITIESVR